jgi:hypothetical protein
MAEDSPIVKRSINMMILFRKMRLSGVCLSLRAFLKSLIIELKAIEPFDPYEKFEGATDI